MSSILLDSVDAMVTDEFKVKIQIEKAIRYLRVSLKRTTIVTKIGHPFNIPSIFQIYPEVQQVELTKILKEIERDIFLNKLNESTIENLYLSIRSDTEVVLLTKSYLYHALNFEQLEKGIVYDVRQQRIIWGNSSDFTKEFLKDGQ